jgi:signal transduction histidine kinase
MAKLRARAPNAADEQAAWIKAAVAQLLPVAEGTSRRPTGATIPRVVVDALRTAVLEASSAEGADARQVLAMLRAIEQLGAEVYDDVASSHVSPASQATATTSVVSANDAADGSEDLGLVVEVAHDLRSPLSSIIFLVETLRSGRSGPVTQLQERQLGLIYGAAFGLSSVVTDLLELVRGSDHFIEPQPVPFSLSELVGGVCDIVRPVAEEKQLELRMVLPERDARIGHPTALARILINLATNALKFTNTGWVEIGVSQLSLTRVEFSVTDTGPGIPAHVQESLYQPFRRHPLARGSRFSSAGLGLSICRRFVQALNSELTVATHEGRGTRFAFQLELPIAAAL